MGNKNSKNKSKNKTNKKSKIKIISDEKKIDKLNQNNNRINQNNNIKENKTKKSISFIYKESKQVIKYYGKFDIISTIKILKDRFFIEESNEQIFFQDDEGDILILNSNIPDNITVNLYIEKDSIPKDPTKVIKIPKQIKQETPLLKFHWILENEEENKRFKDAIVNKYIYKNTTLSENHPAARSSITFTTGIHFFVIRVGSFEYYESLKVVDDLPDIQDPWDFEQKGTSIGFPNNLGLIHKRYNQSVDVGILIDMENKKGAFYDYDKKQIIYKGDNFIEKSIIPIVGKIKSDGVKLVAWLKTGCYIENQGMTILNEGCIPIPDWVKI